MLYESSRWLISRRSPKERVSLQQETLTEEREVSEEVRNDCIETDDHKIRRRPHEEHRRAGSAPAAPGHGPRRSSLTPNRRKHAHHQGHDLVIHPAAHGGEYAAQADAHLPDQVDHEQHADLLNQLAVNPWELLGQGSSQSDELASQAESLHR